MKIISEIPPEAKKGQMVAIDIEMFNQVKGKLHRPVGDFACISITLDGKDVYQLYDVHDVAKALKAIGKGTWVFHNALYDLRQLRRWAEIKPRYIHDTMLLDQSQNGNFFQFYGLDDLSRRWLNKYMDKAERAKFESQKEMTPHMKKYAAQDVVSTLQIAKLQLDEYSERTSFRAYTEEDEPMIFPILDMGGMTVDQKAWSEAVKGFESKAKELEKELGFNVKSNPQVLSALDKIGLHLDSTGAEVLTPFKDRPLVAAILETRMYRDAVSKYGMKFLDKHLEADGKIYPSWHITGAETGRMSSSEPNGQNIPQRKMPIYRSFFVASKGNIIMVSDAHQQEPCILAYESQDEELIGAIARGEDLHYTVAQSIYGKFPKKDPDFDKKRFTGKTINLGTSYGLSPYGLATRLGITEQEASQFLMKYFSRFKGVALWIGLKRQEAYANGYVSTASGRRIYINPYDFQWENNAINDPIQGGAAGMTKRWVRMFWEEGGARSLPYTLTGVIHDETLKDVPLEVKAKVRKLNDDTFSEAANKMFKGINFSVDTKNGISWACKQLAEEALDD